MGAQELKTAICAFMHRDAGAFLVGGVDVCVRTMNNVRLYAERKVDFELARVQARVPSVSLANGGSLDSAVLHSDGVTAVNVKKVKAAFLAFQDGSGYFPINIMSRDHWIFRLKKRMERAAPDYDPESVRAATQPLSLVQLGRTIYITPADTTFLGTGSFTVPMDVIKFLPSYGSTTRTATATSTVTNKLVASAGNFIVNGVSIGNTVVNSTTGGSAIVLAVESATSLVLSGDIFTSGDSASINVLAETDFLIDNCFDWMLYRSVYELNFFLKEDQRVAISDKLMEDAWLSLLSWNTNMIAQSVDDGNLD